MKIVSLNTIPIGSTGKIMLSISDIAREKGLEVEAYSTHPLLRNYHPPKSLPVYHKKYGTFFENVCHFFMARFLGYNGCYSYFSTKRLVSKLKKSKPDILHLHNLHASCIHLKTLFRYIKKNNIRVIWTLHDCWAFTGHCAHFAMLGCNKWKNGCGKCPQHKTAYPKSYRDTSKKMYERKREWFTGVKDMTLVTPSNWLADLVKQSFLKDCPVQVIHNGIDLSIFKPTESDFREKHGLQNKKIVLGVAFGWGKRKGLDVFIELSKRLSTDYQIVLVGTDENVDKHLPNNIFSIHRTQNQKELAEIYTAADVFVNPTREENYPTVNMEAIACGTPVVTFKTGGSPEIVDETCGFVVEKENIEGIQVYIEQVCKEKPFTQEVCLKKAKEFNAKDRFEEYIKLYENITYCPECYI